MRAASTASRFWSMREMHMTLVRQLAAVSIQFERANDRQRQPNLQMLLEEGPREFAAEFVVTGKDGEFERHIQP